MVAFRSSLTGARFARASVLLLGLLAVSALILGAAPLAAAPAAVVGDLRATLTPFDGVTPGAGLRVTYRGLPLIAVVHQRGLPTGRRRTSLWGVRARSGGIGPTWGSDWRSLPPTRRSSSIRHRHPGGNRLILDLRAFFTRMSRPSSVLGRLSPRCYSPDSRIARLSPKASARATSYTGSGTDPRSALVLSPFRRLRVDSRVGTITVEEERAHQGLDLFDARKVPSPWLQASPTLWLGYLEVPLEKGKPFHSRVTLTIDPVEMAERPDRSSPSVKHLPVRDVPDARLSSDPDGRLIPTPRQVRPGSGFASMSRRASSSARMPPAVGRRASCKSG